MMKAKTRTAKIEEAVNYKWSNNCSQLKNRRVTIEISPFENKCSLLKKGQANNIVLENL